MKEKLTQDAGVSPFGRRNIRGYVVGLTDEPGLRWQRSKRLSGS